MPDTGARGRQLRRSRTSSVVLPQINYPLRRLQSQVRYAISRPEKERANQRLGRMVKHFALAAGTDPLTRLPNLATAWSRYDRLMKELLNTTEQRSSPIEVVVAIGLDVQRFKDVNKVHGHTVGDVLLVRLAELLLDHTRWDDFVARIGGDEFIVLVPLRHADLLRNDGRTLTYREVAADLAQRFVLASEKYSAGVGPKEPGIALHIKTAIITRQGLLKGSSRPTFTEVRNACDPKTSR